MNPVSEGVLLRGKACINCRRRKIKCDGDRPSCTQCARSNGAFEDCEYPSGGPTQTQILESRISHLQNRIRQLESNAEPNVMSSGNSPDPVSRPASSHSGRLSSSSPAPLEEPPTDIRSILIETFYTFSARIGFFLDPARFHVSYIGTQPMGHYSRPTPSLMNTIYLWAMHLTPSPPAGFDEGVFLRNALHHLPKDLSSTHPHNIIQSIQAAVLLSYYYLKHGKVLSGNYHANAAISLSLSSGLHRIRASEPTPSHTTPRSSSGLPTWPLQEDDDETKEVERVDAFWAVLVLNNTWIAIQESHSMFHDLQTIEVDTPWPMDAFEYLLKLLPPVSNGTIKRFLESTSIEGFSVMALHAKAAVLLEQATIAGSSSDELAVSPAEPHADIKRLEAVIEQFKAHFPMVDRMSVSPAELDTLLIMQMMTHAAIIKLDMPLYNQGDLRSREKALAAAQAIAVLTHSIHPASSIRIDPIVGVLWTSACEAFINELSRDDSATSPQWSTLLHSIIAKMTSFTADNNLFMNFLVSRIEKKLPANLAPP